MRTAILPYGGACRTAAWDVFILQNALRAIRNAESDTWPRRIAHKPINRTHTEGGPQQELQLGETALHSNAGAAQRSL